MNMLRTGTALLAFFLAACGQSPQEVTSTLIVNASVYDGNGSPASRAAVRFDGDRIVAIGNLQALEGETVIDADGLALAPGFIDAHSHHADDLEDYPHMPAVLSQGITTTTRGLDGYSDSTGSIGHTPQADYVAYVAANPVSVNIASYTPHNSIRDAVMGNDFRREATPEELADMRTLMEADMQAGAIGLSTGLEYDPGIYASTKEIVELAKIAASYGGTYSSHMRDEDDLVFEAIDEVLEIGLNAELPVRIAHIKLADTNFWGRAGEVVEKLEAARNAGIEVSADIYPYLRWQADLTIFFPARDFTDMSVAEYTLDHASTAEDILLAYYKPLPGLSGKTLAEAAMQLEMSPEEALLHLAQLSAKYLEETGEYADSIIAKGMDEPDVVKFMRWQYTGICTDGSHASGHPRGWGSFPRVLARYQRGLGVLSIEEAIHKMTATNADALRLRDRGRVAVGAFADLVLFNPDTITDRASMQDYDVASTGVNKVWVNGVLAFENGEVTDARAGQIVRLN